MARQDYDIEVTRRELLTEQGMYPVGTVEYEVVQRTLQMILRNNGIGHG